MTRTANGDADTIAGAASAQSFDSLDPRTGEVVGRYPLHDATEVNEIVESARVAGRWWAELGFAERKKRLDQWRARLVRGIDELAG